jgi:SAM-dependent methyltransferase
MVHALEEIHRLLRPTGTLIEIHPVHGAWVEVRFGAELAFVEADPGFDSDDELRPTEDALRRVVRRGIFAVEGSHEIDFLTSASSVRELREYFALIGGYDTTPASPTIARRRDELYARAQQALDRSGTDAKLVYREQAKVSRLVPGRITPGSSGRERASLGRPVP